MGERFLNKHHLLPSGLMFDTVKGLPRTLTIEIGALVVLPIEAIDISLTITILS